MIKQPVWLNVSSSVGKVSGEYIAPANPICLLTMAHGAGAGMNHPFMTSLANALAERKIVTLRFNFPFAENKKGRPDLPPIAHKAIEAAINDARKSYSSLPLFISGKSFGGRMSSQYLSSHHDAPVKGIVFFGFPLHPPGNASTERAEHLKEVQQPSLFLSGTRDEFATLDLLESVCAALPKATLIKIEGANHGFKAGKLNTIDMLADYTRDWINKIIK